MFSSSHLPQTTLILSSLLFLPVVLFLSFSFVQTFFSSALCFSFFIRPPLLSFFLSFSRIGDANSGTTTFLSPLDVRQKRKKKERKKLKKKKETARYRGRLSLSRSRIRHGVVTPSFVDLDRLMNFRVTYRGSRKGLANIFFVIFFRRERNLEPVFMRIRAERLFWFQRRFFRLLFFTESQCRHVNFRCIGIHRVFLLLLRFLFLFFICFFFSFFWWNIV